jgi:hypothetical protein
MQKELTAHGVATKALNDALSTIDVSDHPVAEYVSKLAGHVQDALGAAAQFEADKAELAARADLVPAHGLARLAGEAKAEAETRANTQLNNARKTNEVIQRLGLLGAQPQVAKDREALGREELSLVIGSGGTPDQIALRVAKLATDGSRDALAALGSDYGRALLESKGLEGRYLDETLASAKRVIVEHALANPGRHTEAELKSAAIYRSAGEFNAAIAAADFAVRHEGLSHA